LLSDTKLASVSRGPSRKDTWRGFCPRIVECTAAAIVRLQDSGDRPLSRSDRGTSPYRLFESPGNQ
jgi:hypothetical protein